MNITKINRPSKKMFEKVFISLENIRDKVTTNFLESHSYQYFKNELIRKYHSNRYCTLYIAKEKQDIIGFALVIFLQWDSKIFGFKIGRIEFLLKFMNNFQRYGFLNNIIKDCRNKRYRHLNCRLGIKDFETLWLLEKLGFNVADIQLTLSTSDAFKDMPKLSHGRLAIIRKAAKDDLKYLKVFVKGAFTDTRFVVDSRYPPRKVDRLYYEWIKNSIFNVDQRVFVALDKNTKRLIGVSICNISPNSKKILKFKIGSIDLIAINKDYRNQGLGQSLIKFCLNWLKKKVDRVEIRTQVSNIPAIAAFMKGGFKEVTPGILLPAGITMHRWFKEEL